ncbi:rhodanese-like domain-containing protein [Actinotalea sp. M2MS4P-6]|uniref:rhodanese-like domain-containing protein n=1 Tax=Actinotalea sp. M2MS4P-6 TaxID=2983762 RepID=UPI0021E40D5F|nr:rhodanese-like domain-containing protein [Actinotalea sp. M2MS4P-6]MCV2395004.1 rhodanese-like domain-containing protein [Actinotalea sp. M2MS4P-6]
MPSFLDRLLSRDPDALPKNVRVDRALTLLDDGAQLVDVRETSEWKSGHAPQARHIPMAKLAGEARRLKKDVPVVVMCASGSRSKSAAAQLRSMGYKATSLSGGIAAWRMAGGSVR